MRSIVCSILLFCSILISAQSKIPVPRAYSERELLDSVKCIYGIDVKIPSSYEFKVLDEWVNLVSDSGGLLSINLYNGLIKGKDIVVLIRPLDPINPNHYPIDLEAFMISGLQYEFARKLPSCFDQNDYIFNLPTELSLKLFNIEDVQHIPVPTGRKWFSPWDLGVDYGVQELYEKVYPNMDMYFFNIDGKPRFDVVVLCNDRLKHPERRVQRLLGRLFTYRQ